MGEGMVVGVRVGVGGKVTVAVAEGPVAVGKGGVAVRVGVRVGVGVKDGPAGVGVRVDVGSGGASRLISKERTVDHAPAV